MNENPYSNEPGYEVKGAGNASATYNQIIQHETIRIAALDTLVNLQKTFAKFPTLMNEIKRIAPSYFEYYESVCAKNLKLDGEEITREMYKNLKVVIHSHCNIFRDTHERSVRWQARDIFLQNAS